MTVDVFETREQLVADYSSFTSSFVEPTPMRGSRSCSISATRTAGSGRSRGCRSTPTSSGTSAVGRGEGDHRLTRPDVTFIPMGPSVRVLMFSDIEGSTALLERAGVGYLSLLAADQTIVREEIAAAGGVEHGTEGDSFFVSFTSPSGAAAAAVAIQRRTEQWPWPDGQRLRVRIGLHTGEAAEHDGTLIGLAVNHAARVAACAHGGQIVVTEPLRQIVGSLPDGCSWRDLGAHLVRDVGRIGVHQLEHADLQSAFPGAARREPWTGNLPRRLSSFIEPPGLLGSLIEALGRSPVVTLTGTGGVGKTRVALETARRMASSVADGAWFVDLAPISEEADVASTVVTVLPMILTGHDARKPP